MSGALNLCVSDEINQNLTETKKELLKWHFKLGHLGLKWLQWLARKGFLPEILAKYDTLSLKCASCHHALTPINSLQHNTGKTIFKSAGRTGSIK